MHESEDSQVSSQNYFMREDSYDTCCLRFSKWFNCDFTYYDEKAKYAERKEKYPCYKQFYEAQYSCSDDLFDYLLELSYFRSINNYSVEEVLRNELMSNPNVYDNPDAAARIKYTY